MKIKSLTSIGWDLTPIEVEVLLIRGLPDLKFIGLPDLVIRESGIRIKTAIKQAGFSWPEADQIVVNLKPNYLKKSSRGLELAVAAAILWETEQIHRPKDWTQWTLYGELNLDGSIQQPNDLAWLQNQDEITILTGSFGNPHQLPWLNKPIGVIKHLRELSEPHWIDSKPKFELQPPPIQDLFLTTNQAELAQIAAWGTHSLLMAGPAGSGKSMMANLIHSLGSPPSLNTQKNLWHQKLRVDESQVNGSAPVQSDTHLWRPLIQPHHTITVQGLIGGGQPITPGELARAHHGTLVLDELLEFKPQALEALREPLETQKVRIARAQGFHRYDCDIHLIATTNLCPCGEFVPKKITRCRYSLTKCRSYSQKLTGPLVDRFQLLSFSHQWEGERTVRALTLRDELEERRRNFIGEEQRAFVPNARVTEGEFSIDEWPFMERKLLSTLKGSHRRYLSTLRVGMSLAQLSGRTRPNIDDLEKAITYTVLPFNDLQRWD